MSEVKVNKISPRSGTDVTLGDSGDTIIVPAGVGLTATDEVKSNKLSPATGTALQIGDSGDTITIPAGATFDSSAATNTLPSTVVTTTGTQTLTNKTIDSSKIEQVAEKVTNSATVFTGTINFDVITQPIFNATSNASGNWTLNIRGDSSNSLNSIMNTGESITVVTIVPQGGTAYYNSALQIDGSSVTPKWQGGSAPTEGNASSLDTYSYTIIKTADATFTVLAAQTQFA